MIRGNSNTCLKVYIHNTLLRSSCQQPPTTYFSNKENTNEKCNSFDSLYGNVIEYTHTHTQQHWNKISCHIKTQKTCQFQKNKDIRLLFLSITQLLNPFIQNYDLHTNQRLDSSYIACQWVDLNTEVYLMRGESFGVRSFLPPASFNVMYLLRL